MALKPCKECGKEISTEAKVCPNCGKKDPTTSGMSPSRGVFIFLGIVVVFVFLKAVSGGGTDTSSLAPRAVTASPADTAAAARARVTSIARIGAACSLRQARVKKMVADHPTWEDEQIAMVLCKRVGIGMTAAQVRLSWGAPESINTTTYASGDHDQWVYGNSYVYLENGIVTAVQTSK